MRAGGSRRPAVEDAGRLPWYLTGFSGAGKSVVGGILAERAGRPLIDLDDLVAAALGRSVAAIFAELGEGRFRAAEVVELRRLVAELGAPAGALGSPAGALGSPAGALGSPAAALGSAAAALGSAGALGPAEPGSGRRPPVVSLGGGTLETAEAHRLVLESGLLIFIDVPLADCLARLERAGAERPVLARLRRQGGEAAVVAAHARRLSAYRGADLRVGGQERPEVVAGRILEGLGGLGEGRARRPHGLS